MSEPKFTLRFFIKSYLFLASIGCRRLRGFKGIFFRIYHRLKNKHGIIRLRTNDGHALLIDLQDDVIATVLIEYGAWEPSLTGLIKKIVKPGMTVVDIGAHIGYYTTLLSGLVGARGTVIAFEPEPNNFMLLQANTSSKSTCTVVRKGVSNTTGDACLYLATGNLGAHSMHVASEAYINIETVVLDEFLKDRKIDFIKMDIEGNEPFALEGMRKILSQPQVQLIFEYVSGYVAEPNAMFDTLISYGFTLFTVSHETGALTRIQTPPSSEKTTVFNVYCVKES